MAKSLFSKVGLLVKARVRHAIGGQTRKPSKSESRTNDPVPQSQDLPGASETHQSYEQNHVLSADAHDEVFSKDTPGEDDLAARRSRLAKPEDK